MRRGLLTLVLLGAMAWVAAGEPTLEELHARVEELTAAESLEEAVRVAREALALAESEYGSNSGEAARSHDLLATALMDSGESGPAEALPHCERSTEILEKTTGQDRVAYARALWTCGRVRLRLDDLPAAESDFVAALAALEETPDDPTTAGVLGGLVWIQSVTSSYKAALAHAHRHVELLETLVPTDAEAWEVTMALYTVARLTLRVHGHYLPKTPSARSRGLPLGSAAIDRLDITAGNRAIEMTHLAR